MKKIDFFELKVLFAATVLLAIMACTNNKPAEAVENPETAVEATDTLSEEIKQQNMEEVQAFLKECNAFFIATVDGDQPHVRPFGVSEIIDGRLYIITGKVKDVYKQMAANGKFEICALKPSGSEWIRVNGTLVNDDALSVKTEMLERNPSLKSMYQADDDNIAVLYITDGSARFCSFSGPERKVRF
ncbi:MAG: pyridoxamine 5'-phosphate oxidase family protein [Bacteroidaceae bacterium]|nr:pyridoxamine 5'-phosphate oxidase family protein [Bacteroidaceae bacterium]